MEKIFSGNDKARELGFKSFREMTIGLAERKGLKPGVETDKSRVYARVDFGRWIADCECGAANYVEPSDPVYFCATCGNAASGGKWRGVVFPENRAEIEAELLKRDVLVNPKMKPIDGAINAKSVLPGLARSWMPGETVELLKNQRSAVSHQPSAESRRRVNR
jgi:hypothetical protein